MKADFKTIIPTRQRIGNQIIMEYHPSLLEKQFANYKNNEYKPNEIEWGKDVGSEKF